MVDRTNDAVFNSASDFLMDMYKQKLQEAHEKEYGYFEINFNSITNFIKTAEDELRSPMLKMYGILENSKVRQLLEDMLTDAKSAVSASLDNVGNARYINIYNTLQRQLKGIIAHTYCEEFNLPLNCSVVGDLFKDFSSLDEFLGILEQNRKDYYHHLRTSAFKDIPLDFVNYASLEKYPKEFKYVKNIYADKVIGENWSIADAKSGIYDGLSTILNSHFQNKISKNVKNYTDFPDYVYNMPNIFYWESLEKKTPKNMPDDENLEELERLVVELENSENKDNEIEIVTTVLTTVINGIKAGEIKCDVLPYLLNVDYENFNYEEFANYLESIGLRHILEISEYLNLRYKSIYSCVSIEEAVQGDFNLKSLVKAAYQNIKSGKLDMSYLEALDSQPYSTDIQKAHDELYKKMELAFLPKEDEFFSKIKM